MLAKTPCLLLIVLSLSGCARTHQALRVEKSGFLRDYSQLKPGEEGEALLIYRKPDVDFKKYTKLIVDPVTVWRPADSDLSEVPEEELNQLANYLHTAVVQKLEEDYTLVKGPGPDVLRVRIAITEAAKSYVVLDTLSTIIPQIRLISAVKKLRTGTHAYVGRASLEGELVDSATGERLVAAVDRRAGAKVLRGSLSSWGDVKAAYDHWAERLRDRLREARGVKETKENAE